MELQHLQEWFSVALRGEKLGCEHLQGDPDLEAPERMEIYRRLYWDRLVQALHQFFPFTLRLFGYEDFERLIGRPYLIKYPPTDWALNQLGSLLPRWIEEEYHAKDKELVLEAVQIDWVYTQLFSAGERPALKEIVSRGQRLFLQPFVFPMEIRGDLLALREQFLEKEVDYWMQHDFPKVSGKERRFFLLYRSGYHILFDEICEARYRILCKLKQGIDLEELSCFLESQHEAMVQDLQEWFLEWTCKQWLAT